MTARTITLRDGRLATEIPADEAGEFLLSAAEGILAHLASTSLLTRRQLDAAAELARLYGIGGGTMPWRTRGGGADRPEEVVAEARAAFKQHLDAAPHITRWPIIVLCQGEWPVGPMDPLPLLRDGLDAVADRMRLAI